MIYLNAKVVIKEAVININTSNGRLKKRKILIIRINPGSLTKSGSSAAFK